MGAGNFAGFATYRDLTQAETKSATLTQARSCNQTLFMVGKLMLQISALLLALCPTINASPKDEFHRTIQTVKRSIAAVACLQKESDRNVSIASIEGTGFFISRDGVFLTAGHIAHGLYLGSPPRQKACEIPAVYVPKKRWGKAKEQT